MFICIFFIISKYNRFKTRFTSFILSITIGGTVTLNVVINLTMLFLIKHFQKYYIASLFTHSDNFVAFFDIHKF